MFATPADVCVALYSHVVLITFVTVSIVVILTVCVPVILAKHTTGTVCETVVQSIHLNEIPVMSGKAGNYTVALELHDPEMASEDIQIL